jgi:hypothetical protein
MTSLDKIIENYFDEIRDADRMALIRALIPHALHCEIIYYFALELYRRRPTIRKAAGIMNLMIGVPTQSNPKPRPAFEVNLPGVLRQRTLRSYKKWLQWHKDEENGQTSHIDWRELKRIKTTLFEDVWKDMTSGLNNSWYVYIKAQAGSPPRSKNVKPGRSSSPEAIEAIRRANNALSVLAGYRLDIDPASQSYLGEADDEEGEGEGPPLGAG